jgi:hypothetical protein
MIIPNIWKNKNVPHRQPDIVASGFASILGGQK